MKGNRRTFVATAIALGVAAPFVGSPYRRKLGTVDVAELARVVERREDHVDAQELAGWIRSRRSDVRVVDLRSPEDFRHLHIPGAENMALRGLLDLPLASDETLVLYGEGGAHAAQGWVFMRALGHERSYFLASGIHEWVERVLEPKLPVDATDAERRDFEKAAELSRYFGGVPRVDVPRAEVRAHDAILRRRGC